MRVARRTKSRLSDQLPNDWRRRVASYRGLAAAHFKRVLRKLSSFEWMTQDERERAAFVIVEKEQLRELSQRVASRCR